MIRHIKLIFLLSIIVIVFACKKEQNNNLKLPTKSNVIFSDIKSNSDVNNIYQYATSYKINKNYNSSDKSITDKFKNLIFNFTNDTIIKVNGKETEILYRDTILAKKYFGHKYLYRAYSNFLHDKLNINLPKYIEYVSNENSHLKQSILYDLFKEGFFIKDNFIFEYEGNIIIFQNKETVIKRYNKKVITLPFSEDDFESDENSYPCISEKIQKKIQNLIITQDPSIYEIECIIQINNKMDFDTYVYFVTGDSSFSELINVKDQKIISNVLVGHQYPGNKTYETFLIEKDFSIKIYEVEYETKINKILEKYQIQNDGTIKKIFSYRKKVNNSNYSAPN